VECKSCKDLPRAPPRSSKQKRQRGCGDVAIVQREEKEVAGLGLVHLVGLQESERE
jgi:hypothetical protein